MRAATVVVRIAAFAALVALTVFLLHLFAQREFSAHLRDQAAQELAAAARGETRWRWRFRDAEDVVAGRVFGAAEFAFHEERLIARSSGSGFEIGLPLPRPVDLTVFPQMHIAASVDAPARLDVLVRESLDAPLLELDGPILAPGSDAPAVDLARADWRSSGSPARAPARAAMLRLRVRLPSDATLQLREAALLRSSTERLDLARPPRVVDPLGAEPTDATPVYRIPFRADLRGSDLDAIAQRTRAPLILLPQRGRVEQQIALRNAVFDALPAATLLPETALDETFALARGDSGAPSSHDALRWTALGVYVIAVLWIRLRPPAPRRGRALLEVLLALAGPLWLIVFDQFSGKPDALQATLIAVSSAYAISLSVPRRWQWNGSARTWLLAFAIVGCALLLGLVLHDGDAPTRAISPNHSARYIVWALVQQYLICAVCTERWRDVTGSRWSAAYLGALGFALLHTPNAALMIATFAAGLCWCALYLRERALLPLAVSHAASALLLLALLPRSLLASAEVSVRFFQ